MTDLSVENICVKYPKKTVLKNVSVTFHHSQIHMLIGENGAGKSTLTKVICGDLLPSSGSLFINNQEVKFKNPADAIKNGIVSVHQRPLLADSISILENLKIGVKDFYKAEVIKLLSFWLPGVNPKTLVRDCGGDLRFFVSLTGALLKNPSVLILDEPSALLDLNQRDFLFANLKKFAGEGMNIIIITHYMKEAKAYGDTITYLEDGEIHEPDEKFLNLDSYSEKNSFQTDAKIEAEQFDSSKNKIASAAAEKQIKKADIIQLQSENEEEKSQTKANLSFNNINVKPADKPAVTGFSFTARQGEITLIEGLAEDGRETLEDFIYGMADCRQSGELEIFWNKDRRFNFKIKNGNFTRRRLEKTGFCFGIIPSNKTFRGSNPKLTILQLLTSGIKSSSSGANRFKPGKNDLEKYAEKLIKNAGVNITTSEKADCLSGGMLQRLILERELKKNPEILILCEPVQGLDSLSTERLCQRLKDEAAKGKIVLVLSSSEFPEKICSRIYRLEKSL